MQHDTTKDTCTCASSKNKRNAFKHQLHKAPKNMLNNKSAIPKQNKVGQEAHFKVLHKVLGGGRGFNILFNIDSDN